MNMKKEKEVKKENFLYRTTSEELFLLEEYSRVLGISKSKLVREAVRKFMEDNKDVYLGIRNGDLVSVKKKGYNVVVYQRGEYEELKRLEERVIGDIEA